MEEKVLEVAMEVEVQRPRGEPGLVVRPPSTTQDQLQCRRHELQSRPRWDGDREARTCVEVTIFAVVVAVNGTALNRTVRGARLRRPAAPETLVPRPVTIRPKIPRRRFRRGELLRTPRRTPSVVDDELPRDPPQHVSRRASPEHVRFTRLWSPSGNRQFVGQIAAVVIALGLISGIIVFWPSPASWIVLGGLVAVGFMAIRVRR